METSEIVKAIRKLPVNKRMMIIEQTLKGICEEETGNEMEKAAGLLYNDYKEDKNLTEFCVLDCENFYETR